MGTLRLGLGSYAYAWAIGIPGHIPPMPMTAYDLITHAADLGLHVVQIADNLPLHILTEAEQDALIRHAQKHSVAIEIGTRGIDPEHLRRYLALAVRFGSPVLRVVIDTADHHPPVAEVIATLQTVMPEFAALNVTLALENHDRFKARTFVEIVQAVGSQSEAQAGSRIGICLDTVNSLGAGEGAEVVVAALAPYTVNLHLKDFTIRRHPTMLGFEVQGTPAGQGMLDVPWLLDQLVGTRYANHDHTMSAILELWPPPQADLAATIALEDTWVRQSVRYLRTLISV